MKSENLLEQQERGIFAILSEAAALNLQVAEEIYSSTQLQSIDFLSPGAGALWQIVGDFLKAKTPLDIMAIGHRAQTNNEIQRAGGQKFVAEWLMPTAFPSREIAGEYAKVILDASLRRRAVAILKEAFYSLKNPATDCLEALNVFAEKLTTLSKRIPSLQQGTGFLQTVVQQLEDAIAGKRQLCLPTGIRGLDAVIGGLQSSVLTLVGAYPGVGKSALLATIAYSLCRRGVKVGFFSLEDEGAWLARRWLANKSAVPLFNLQTGDLKNWEWDALAQTEPTIFEALKNLIVDERPSLTVAEIVAAANEMILTHKVQVLFVDHLGEVQMPRSERYDLDVADALAQLRNLAKKHEIPVVVASHVRRRSGLTVDDAPALTDFANSSAPERMARVALGLSRHEKGVVCTILKQTNGPSGATIGLEMHKSSAMVFEDREFIP